MKAIRGDLDLIVFREQGVRLQYCFESGSILFVAADQFKRDHGQIKCAPYKEFLLGCGHVGTERNCSKEGVDILGVKVLQELRRVSEMAVAGRHVSIANGTTVASRVQYAFQRGSQKDGYRAEGPDTVLRPPQAFVVPLGWRNWSKVETGKPLDAFRSMGDQARSGRIMEGADFGPGCNPLVAQDGRDILNVREVVDVALVPGRLWFEKRDEQPLQPRLTGLE